VHAGDRFKAAVGDGYAELGDRAEIAVGDGLAGELTGEVLTEAIGGLTQNFVILPAGVEAGAKDDDRGLNLAGNLRNPTLPIGQGELMLPHRAANH